ncbi:MAG: N-acetylmuramoyl-L-alanine amidase, partial [Candidatus Kapaibacterium sp.]
PSKARGCETYILSPAKTAAAIDVAARENGVVQLEDERERYSGMTEDRQVLATLAQTSFAKFSSAFALAVQKHLAPGTGLPDRGVSQAGFLVLVCASMPAVLVETGFVSNPEDERLLFAKDGQRRIARGIASAVVEYASAYATVVGR